jgi:hypothetical protein
MIFGYMDDSSDGYRADYFVSGGVVASEERWTKSRPSDLKAFHVDWMSALALRQVDGPFHSADCASRRGAFVGWEKEDCNALMRNLVDIIVDHGISGFASIVPIKTYKQVFPRAKTYDPYYLAVRHTLVILSEIGQMEKDSYGFGGMKCWFEYSRDTKPTIERIYEDLKNVKTWKPANSLKETANFEGKEVVPLQSADMVAREAFRRYMYPTQSSKQTEQMKSQLNFACWNLATLEYLRDHGGPNDMEAFTNWKTNADRPPQFDVFCEAPAM